MKRLKYFQNNNYTSGFNFSRALPTLSTIKNKCDQKIKGKRLNRKSQSATLLKYQL